MSDILIRGIEKLKEPTLLTLYSDGCWNDYTDGTSGELITLPEGYGRLIDADVLLNESCDVIEDHSGLDYIDPCPVWGYSVDMINRAPTIVPAEGDSEK